MSAFAGLIHLDGVAPSSDRAAQLAGALVGRGFSAPPQLRQADTSVLAFRPRPLLPGYRQDHAPHVDHATGAVSLFDGRLDNRADLLDYFSGDAPLSDGALAARAYRRWGLDAPGRLLGDFAWAVWDAAEQRLLLARDHSIHRALFYYRTDRLVAFATTYRALLALPEVPCQLDETRIVELIVTAPDTSDRGLYQGVRWVRPAEMVILTRAGMRQSRFWLPDPRSEPSERADAEVLAEAGALFDRAVACRDVAAGPPVIMMSGGVDSAAIAATVAARRAPELVTALTVLPADDAPDSADGTRYRDERPLVDAVVARHSNLGVEYLTNADPVDFELDPGALFAAGGVPLRGAANTAWFQPVFRRAEALGAPVVLSGGFGNMTLSADGLSRLGGLSVGGEIAEFLALRAHAPNAVWRRLARRALEARLPWLRSLRQPRGDGGWATEWRRRTALNPDFLHDAAFRARFAENAVVEFDRFGADGRRRELVYLMERTRMQVEARAAMRSTTGVDMADPYSDRRIIDFCLALPDDQFLRNGQPRFLARRLFADRLPAAVLSNQRRGEQNADWYLRLAPQRERLEATIEQLERSSLARRLLDLPRLSRMLRDMPSDPDDLRRTGDAYKVMFTRALHAGRFLAWHERAN